jgi:hypothetical protein
VTVAQLIEELQKMPPHARVRTAIDAPVHVPNDPTKCTRWYGDKDGEIGAVVYEGAYVLLQE